MSVPLHVLLVEDKEDDALIIVHHIRRKGYDIQWQRVDNAHDMRTALHERVWDVVLADYTLPEFSAPEALTLLKENGVDLPFIIVSGTIDEQTAVASMEAGAHDYVTKGHLIRLVPAIEREIREANERRDHKQSVEALRRSEERFRTVVDASIDALISIDMDGSISLFNKAASRLLKYDWTEILGRPIESLIVPAYRSNLNLFIVSHKSTNYSSAERAPANSIELLVLTRDGRELPVELSLSRGIRDQVDFLLVIMRDLSEIKASQEVLQETEAQLRFSQKMEAIGRLAGGVAHDFNNLLGAILGYSDVMLLDVKEEDPLREDILEISRAAKKAAELTQQLLVFSRKQIMQPRTININSVVKGSERMLGRMIGEDIQLITQLNPDLKSARVDPAQMEQVIMNLVVNARDAMPAGGTVTIETTNEDIPIDRAVRDFQNTIAGQVVVLQVKDSGLGMGEEILSNIFEPFFTTKDPGKGTGLGLSTVFGIVKQSDGVITVDSTPKEGTVFRVYLPVVNEEPREALTRVNAGGLHLGTETVMVVEDEQMLRTLISRVLRKHGYTVYEASDGQEAITLFERVKETVDLVITDVIMPNMNGRQLATRLQELSDRHKLIFMSGYADDILTQHGIFDRGQSYIQKPFSADFLCERVRQVLAQ